MPRMVSMVRGINVAGARPLKMAKLREIYERLGFKEVRTYLQSGNAVCRVGSGDAGRHAAAIERAIKEECQYQAPVSALSEEAISAVVASNPLIGRPSVNPAFLHVTFLMAPSGASPLDRSRVPLGPGEDIVIVGNVAYLYCPNGYGNTKINNAYFEKALSTRATTRNWRTVLALERMARGLEA